MTVSYRYVPENIVCVYQAPSPLQWNREEEPEGESAERATHSSDERVIYVDCPSQETTLQHPPAINPAPHLTSQTQMELTQQRCPLRDV